MVIVTANRLRDGAVVFRTIDGWSTDIAHARLAAEANGDALLAEAQAGPKPLPVVAPYIVETADDGGVPRPTALRERIRVTGPTV